MALAKSLSANTTVITVSPRFHTFAADPEMIIDTPQEFEREREAVAATILGAAEAVAKASRGEATEQPS